MHGLLATMEYENSTHGLTPTVTFAIPLHAAFAASCQAAGSPVWDVGMKQYTKD
jgi:hypothetical protein